MNNYGYTIKNYQINKIKTLVNNVKVYRFALTKNLDNLYDYQGFKSGPTWARTKDHLIMSQVL